jgi:hypothetical protein
MKKLLIGIILIVSGCGTVAPTDPIISRKFIGVWSWKPIKGDSCPETHEYLANGHLIVHSGEEILEKSYFITGVGGGFYQISTTNLKSNGKKDCFGNFSTLKNTNHFFVWFNNSGTLTTCSTADGMACYGTANLAKK